MLEIIVIEIICIVSFIYSLIIIVLPFASLSEIFLVFLWTIFGSIVFSLSYKKSKIFWFSGLLLLMPVIFYNTKTSILFILITSILIMAYIFNFLGKGSHYDYVSQLKKSYVVYLIIFVLGLISEGINALFSNSIVFVIVYLLTSIVLTRTVLHIESGMDRTKIRKINAKYLVVVSVLSFVITVDKFRNFIFLIFSKVYLFIIEIITKLLYYPFIFLFMIIHKIISFFISIIGSNEEPYQVEGIAEIEEGIKTVEEITMEFPILNMIIKLILVAFILYIIYKILVKTGNNSYSGIDYTERRKYIRLEDRKKKPKDKFPKDLREQIRYYYRRYLDRLEKEKIEVKKSDTSMEINEKAEEVLTEEIEGVRNIYIESRYGDKTVDESTVEEMKSLYKSL